ncbi:MAG: PilZ domain-containing protein [Candidatus Hydrogenedentes bacterium]|nr:PilZ domain-containing protein [Candidatus Hydrogenedentota bacterium]
MTDIPANPIHTGNTAFLFMMDQRFLVQIRGVDRIQIWVSFPGVNYPVPGLGGRLEFHHDRGFVAYNVQVLRYADRPEDGLILERSESAERRTHRSAWRVPTEIPVRFRTLDAPDPRAAVMEDLSADGCQLRADALLAVRTPIELRFALDRQHGELVSEGRICYVQEETSLRAPASLRYGVRFTSMSGETRRLLTLFLYHHVRRLYPKEVAAMYPRVRKAEPPVQLQPQELPPNPGAKSKS